MQYRWGILAAALAAMVASGSQAQSIAVPKSLADQGKIIICSDLNSPPMQYVSENGAVPDGVAIDMLNLMGERLGLPIEIMNVKFSGIFAAIDTDRCDAIVASTSRRPERLEKYDFVLYWSITSGLLVKAGNPENLKTFYDLSGRRVGVLLGSSNEGRLKQANETLVKEGKAPMEIVPYSGNVIVFQELNLGRVEAMVSDSAVLAYYMTRSDGKFEIGGTPVPPTALGIVVKKQRPDVTAALQEAMHQIMADGSLAAKVEEWGLTPGLAFCDTPEACP